MRGFSEEPDLTDQLRPLVEILRANEGRATSIEVQERIRDAIELFEEYAADRCSPRDET
jgi:hypothetical protein